MKKLLCICMALLITCPALAEAGDSVPALIDLLDEYLALNEQLFAGSAAAFQCMEDFYAKRDYLSLVSLRIICDQGQLATLDLAAPELSLTDEQLLELMSKGVQTDTLEFELQATSQTIQGTFLTQAFVEEIVDWMMQSSVSMERLYASGQIYRQSRELLMRKSCVLMNYLLLPLADAPQVQEFWTSIPQRYPTLGGIWMDWESDKSAIDAQLCEYEAEYAELLSRSSELLGADNYSLDRAIHSLVQGNAQALTADAWLVDGMPTMVPLPRDWLEPECSFILTTDATPGVLPDKLILCEDGVPRAHFDSYVQQLIDFGATLFMEKGSDAEGWMYALDYDSQLLMLVWKSNGTASITYEPAFISLEQESYVKHFL